MGSRSYDRKVLYVFFFFGGRLRMPPPPPDAYRTTGTAVVGSRNLGINGTVVGLAGAVRLSLAKEAKHRLREAICRSANKTIGLSLCRELGPRRRSINTSSEKSWVRAATSRPQFLGGKGQGSVDRGNISTRVGFHRPMKRARYPAMDWALPLCPSAPPKVCRRQ